VDDFFVERFYGLSGVGLSATECRASDFASTSAYRALRDRVSASVEEKKYVKFALTERSAVLTYDTNIDNQTLCRVCNLRKITHNDERCDVCRDFVGIGKKLTTSKTVAFVRDNPSFEIFDGYGITFDPPQHASTLAIFAIDNVHDGAYPFWPLRSYVFRDDNDDVADFDNLASSALKEINGERKGTEALGVLKADVDDMGRFLRESDAIDSFENFSVFSQGLDNFFSIEIPRLMEEQFPHTYTVFAGGDDLFLIGAWDEILKLSREIIDRFDTFAKKELSLSIGLLLVKPHTPVSYVAQKSEEALEKSKEVKDKASITLFGETAKNSEYLEEGKVFREALEKAEAKGISLPSAFLYRLLELLDMRMRMKKDESFFEGSMWKSKLNYAFRRNIFERIKNNEKQKTAQDLLMKCNSMIEEFPEVARMVLSEFIYTRRKTL
jgi:CRISPR-associated protein Csm1